MFYVKNDDMEDLFREAAENYHLDTEKAADWDRIHDVVHGNIPEADDLQKPDKRKKRRFAFWWLLLLPLGWLANYTWESWKEKKGTNSEIRQAVAPGNANDKKDAGNKTVKNFISDDQVSKGEGLTAQQNGYPKLNESPSLSDRSIKQKFFNSPLQKNELQQSDMNGILSNPSGINPDKIADPGKSVVINADPIKIFPDNSQTNAKENSATDNKPDIKNITDQNANNSATKRNDIKKKRESYFYAGVVVAPDISLVKFQKTSAIGLSGGLILGYHVSKRLNVETGLLLAKKNYYTEGEYFSKDNVPYLNYVDLLSVDGNCKMFEIPLNLRYSFVVKQKSALYATAGFSSYLMNKESYTYSYMYNGVYGEKPYTYDHSSKNWFSILNFGAGYERNLGKKNLLKIEPYFKVPISGVGMGKLPISSAGIYVGFSRKLQ